MEMGPLVWGIRTKLPDGQIGIRPWDPDDADDMKEAFAWGPAPELLPEGPQFDVNGQQIVVSQAMVEMEKRRRARQRRIYKKMCLIKGRVENQVPDIRDQDLSQAPGPPAHANKPVPAMSSTSIPPANPQQAATPISRRSSWVYDDGTSDVVMTEPASAHYEQIRAFLLVNRSQGLLCLDSLPRLEHHKPDHHGRFFSEHLLLHHILQFGGLAITPNEWREFLQVANERNEMFRWDAEGRGQVFWIESPDHEVPWRPNPLGTSKLRLTTYWAESVQALCEYQDWMEDYPIDWDPQFLQWKLNQVRYKWCGGECPITFMDNKKQHIVAFIDYWDRAGMYWCWGPNRTARRMLGSWKERSLYHDEGDVFDFPETKPKKKPTKPPKLKPSTESSKPDVPKEKEEYQIWWEQNHGEASRVRPRIPPRPEREYVLGKLTLLQPGGGLGIKKLMINRKPVMGEFPKGVRKRPNGSKNAEKGTGRMTFAETIKNHKSMGYFQKERPH